MRIAILGDIHLYRRLVPPWRVFNKRFLGLLSLYFHRQFAFDPRLLPMVLRQIRDLEPDLLLLSGDISTTAYEAEFRDFLVQWRAVLGHVPTWAVPGNHDRYTHLSAHRRVFERCMGDLALKPLPLLRPLGPGWSLLALDPCRPRAIDARGKLGPAQLAAARRLLAELPADQGVVVLSHYPILLPNSVPVRRAHRLDDARQLRDLLAEQRRPLVHIHGHVHRPWCITGHGHGLPGLVDVNAGAPCLRSAEYPLGQGFWQLDLPEGAGPAGIVHHLPDALEATPATPLAAALNWTAQAFV